MEFKLPTWCWHDLHTIFGRVRSEEHKTDSEEQNNNLFNHLEWIKISLLNIYEIIFPQRTDFWHMLPIPLSIAHYPFSAYVLFLLWQVEYFIFHNQESFSWVVHFIWKFTTQHPSISNHLKMLSDFNAKFTKCRENNQTRMISIWMAENNIKSINFFYSEKQIKT